MQLGLTSGLGGSYKTANAFPAAQTIAWGAKTLTGHGAHLLNYQGAGTLSIVSQKDASNVNSTIWQIGQNGLSWKGASATYGSAAPASLNGPYTVEVTDGSSTSVITINIIANAFHIREMTASGANGGRWTTVTTGSEAYYTVDGTATNGPTQLRTVLLGTTLVLGDTIYCRDGIFNPTSADVRMRIKAGGYSGTGVITIRSDTVDITTDEHGWLNREHGAEMRRLAFDSAASGDIYFPITLQDLHLSTSVLGTDCVSYSANGWGVSTDNCRLAGVPSLVASTCRGMTLRGSQTEVVSAANCTLTNLSKGFVVASSPGTGGAGRTKDPFIHHHYAYGLYEDLATGGGENVIVEDNFCRDFVDLSIGDHSDAYQHQHLDGLSPTTYDGFKARRNICVINPGYSYAPQGWFTDDSAAARTLTGVEVEHNILISGNPNGVFLARTTNPRVQFNTTLSWVINSASTFNVNVVVPTGKAGVDGTFNKNVANDITVSDQTGTVVSTPNTALSRSLSAYQTAFPDYSEGLYTVAAVKAAVTPANVLVADGGCKNPDGTYNGAIGPDGDWNTGLVY